jgi:3-oxoacyl-[acyl-carrier protein] reductase
MWSTSFLKKKEYPMTKKIAIITGANRGVGKAVAINLAKNNYFVVLVARDLEKLRDVYDEIISFGGNADYLVTNVSDSNQVKETVDQIIKKHGHIDLLFNNAAILFRGTTELSDEKINELLTINLHGAIYFAKYVALQMKKQRSGYIMNISSLGGKNAASFSGVYAASKFGLSGYSEALTKEMSLYNVKVTNICPSMIATEMAQGRKFKPDQMIHMEDIVKTVDYLLSLSSNAIPAEILISCLPLITATTENMEKMYLS